MNPFDEHNHEQNVDHSIGLNKKNKDSFRDILKDSKKMWSFVSVIFLSFVLFYSGFISGKSSVVEAVKLQNVSVTVNGENAEVTDFSIFWKAWNLIDEKFVQTHGTSTKATNQDRVYGAIQGMVDSLDDPYTSFFPPKEAAAFETEIEGNFEGVGMEMGLKNDVLTVVAPLKGSPAEKAGMLSGDKVIEINGKSTAGFSVEQAVSLIRGKRGTSVTLSVLRASSEKPVSITIVRDVINLPTLDTSFDSQNKIFTIKLFTFSAQSSSLFRNALRDFVNSNSNKLILDLRGNPGGFLEAAVDMASWFLPAGKIVVQEDYGNGKETVIERSKGYNIFSDSLRMVVLIDGGSASASEILAGALNEYGKAKIVGTKSFGKGSVQEYIKIDDKSALKVTVAKWLTPNGKSISDGGLTPDFVVEMTEKDVLEHKDPQMQKAIELLSM